MSKHNTLDNAKPSRTTAQSNLVKMYKRKTKRTTLIPKIVAFKKGRKSTKRQKTKFSK